MRRGDKLMTTKYHTNMNESDITEGRKFYTSTNSLVHDIYTA